VPRCVQSNPHDGRNRQQAAEIKQADTNAQFAQKDTKRGHWLGFAVAIAALIAAIVALLLGNPWVAGLCLSVPVLSVARAFVDSVVKAK
jgi:Flp pilus assembly protein TadB